MKKETRITWILDPSRTVPSRLTDSEWESIKLDLKGQFSTAQVIGKHTERVSVPQMEIILLTLNEFVTWCSPKPSRHAELLLDPKIRSALKREMLSRYGMLIGGLTYKYRFEYGEFLTATDTPSIRRELYSRQFPVLLRAKIADDTRWIWWVIDTRDAAGKVRLAPKFNLRVAWALCRLELSRGKLAKARGDYLYVIRLAEAIADSLMVAGSRACMLVPESQRDQVAKLYRRNRG